MSTPPVAAVAIARGAKPAPELAGEAVSAALARAGAGIARGVLLFLTAEFHRSTGAAVAAASRAGHCLQVAGCTVPGVFTDTDQALERPAAAALVITGDRLGLAAGDGTAPQLSFAALPQAGGDWLAGPACAGVVSADAAIADGGQVWGQGKICTEGRYAAVVRGARGVVAVSRGVQKLGPILTVSAVHGHDVIATDGQPALTRLLRELPLDWRGQERPPWHSLFAAVLACDTPDALAEGCYELIPVIAGSDSGVTLSASIAPGTRIAWCLRQPIAAERDTRVALRRAAAELGERPGFAVVFSCIGRGPYFFGGVDRDLEIARSLWPGTPMIGVYGAGEIAPLPMGNRVIHNGAVFVAYASEQR